MLAITNSNRERIMSEETTREEVIDDDDIDCFGNFDKRERICLKKCGVSNECRKITLKLEKDKLNYSDILNSNVEKSKKVVQNSQPIQQTMNEAKQKQEMEKTMVKVKKSAKSGKSVKSEKVISKVKKTEGTEKKKGRTRRVVDVTEIEGTVLPIGFEVLLEGLKKLGDMKGKKSVTSFSKGGTLFCSVVKLNRTKEKTELYLNRSAGAKLEHDTKHTELGKWPGDIIKIIVNSNEKSQKEALVILKKWVGMLDNLPKKERKVKEKTEKVVKVAPVVKKIKQEKKGKKSKKGEKEEKNAPSVKAKKSEKTEAESKPEPKKAPVVAPPSGDDEVEE